MLEYCVLWLGGVLESLLLANPIKNIDYMFSRHTRCYRTSTERACSVMQRPATALQQMGRAPNLVSLSLSWETWGK